MCLCQMKNFSLFLSFVFSLFKQCRGARPSVPTLPNEAMSLQGKQLGTPTCVPADSFQHVAETVYLMSILDLEIIQLLFHYS